MAGDAASSAAREKTQMRGPSEEREHLKERSGKNTGKEEDREEGEDAHNTNQEHEDEPEFISLFFPRQPV